MTMPQLTDDGVDMPWYVHDNVGTHISYNVKLGWTISQMKLDWNGEKVFKNKITKYFQWNQKLELNVEYKTLYSFA